jgi:hypothetical protein
VNLRFELPRFSPRLEKAAKASHLRLDVTVVAASVDPYFMVCIIVQS